VPEPRLHRVLFFVAMAGLALVLVGTLLRTSGSIWIAVAGFALLLPSGVLLQDRTYKWRTRPSRQIAGPSVGSVAASQLLVSGNRQVGGPEQFDLSKEYESHRRFMRNPLVIARVGLAGFFVLIDVALLVSGVTRGNSTLLGGGIALAPLVVILIFLIWRLNRGVLSASVDAEGVKFVVKPGGRVVLPWQDSRFAITIRETPASAREKKDGVETQAAFRLFTQAGDGPLRRTQIITSIPSELAMLLLHEGPFRGLTVTGPTVYRPGTMSEIRIYRITAPGLARPQRGFAPVSGLPPPGHQSADTPAELTSTNVGAAPPSPQSGGPRFCANCGAALPAGSVYCPSCGRYVA